jgi:hypothetical protein
MRTRDQLWSASVNLVTYQDINLKSATISSYRTKFTVILLLITGFLGHVYCLVFCKEDSASKTGSFSVNSNMGRHLRGWFLFKVLIVITGQVLIYCCVF